MSYEYDIDSISDRTLTENVFNIIVYFGCQIQTGQENIITIKDIIIFLQRITNGYNNDLYNFLNNDIEILINENNWYSYANIDHFKTEETIAEMLKELVTVYIDFKNNEHKLSKMLSL